MEEEQAKDLLEQAKELDPSVISPSLIEQATDALAPVAEKIGEGAEFGYEIVFRQVLADAAVSLLVFALVVALGIVLYKKAIPFLYGSYKKSVSSSSYDDGFAQIMTGMFLFVTYVGLFIPVIIMALEAIKKFINPHYYTIEEIIRLAQGVL